MFEGTTPYYDPAANGALAGSISLPGINDSRFYGYNGSALLSFYDQYSNGYYNGIFGEVAVADGRFTWDIGPTTGTTSICADGTPLSSCASGNHNLISATAAAGWDPVNALWLILSSDNRTVRTFGTNRTGVTGTAAVFNNSASSFLFKRFPEYPANSFFYYCNTSTGKITLRKVETSTEVALNWPIAKVGCTGGQLVYDETNGSIVFPFTQNGLSGVAEVFNAHPSANGL